MTVLRCYGERIAIAGIGLALIGIGVGVWSFTNPTVGIPVTAAGLALLLWSMFPTTVRDGGVMRFDVQKIPGDLMPNFKGTAEQRQKLLNQQVGDLDIFLGDHLPAGAKDACDLWVAVAQQHGESAVFQFCTAVRTVNKLQEALDVLHDNGHRGMAYNNMGLLALLYVELMEFVERGHYVSFENWLSKESSNCRLPEFGTTESNSKRFRKWLHERGRSYVAECGAARAVQNALEHGLTAEEKQTLLKGFLFSKPTELWSEGNTEYRHLHCEGLQPRSKWGCMSNCPEATTDEIAKHLPRLAKHLYSMRSALVHRATGTAFVDPATKEVGEGASSFFDIYFTSDGKIVHYDATIKREDLFPLFKRCLVRRVLDQDMTPSRVKR